MAFISATTVQKAYKPEVTYIYGKASVDSSGVTSVIRKNGGSVGIHDIVKCDAVAGCDGMYAVVFERGVQIAGINEGYDVCANIHDVNIVPVPAGVPYVQLGCVVFAYGISGIDDPYTGAPLGHQYVVIAYTDAAGVVSNLPEGVALFSLTVSTSKTI